MNGGLIILLSEAKTAETLRRANARRSSSATREHHRPHDAIVRLAGDADAPAIERLAQLEGRRLPPGPALVAEQDGEVLAALSLHGGGPIADPFRPTAELAEQLGRALAHLRAEGGRRRWSLWGLLRNPRGARREPSAPTVPGNELSLIR